MAGTKMMSCHLKPKEESQFWGEFSFLWEMWQMGEKVKMWLSDVQEAVPWLRVYSSRLFPFGIIKPWTPLIFCLNPVLEFAVIMYISPHFSFRRRFDAGYRKLGAGALG